MAVKESYKIETNVWVYPGDAAWHFVSLTRKLSQEIKERYGKQHRGFGSLPVRVTLGTLEWATSIFPTKEGSYLLPVKAGVRKKAGIREGDMVALTLVIDTGAARARKV